MIVGINSDASVRAIKGEGRPVNDQESRRAVLLGLKAVDEVLIFDELTPDNLVRQINPDVLVKGGDWKESEIIGADLVRANGGEVFSLPLLDGYSTSGLIERMAEPTGSNLREQRIPLVDASLLQHLGVFEKLRDSYSENIRECAELILETFNNGNKVLICGNGGSAADAQHLAAEFVGRYETERRGLPAIALTTDTSALTALSNDYGFDDVFAKQVKALAAEGDCLIAISTSGNSPNVIAAVMAARDRGCRILGMTGAGGKKLAGLCDACIMVPSDRTARVQEAHITIAHIWCEIIDGHYANIQA